MFDRYDKKVKAHTSVLVTCALNGIVLCDRNSTLVSSTTQKLGIFSLIFRSKIFETLSEVFRKKTRVCEARSWTRSVDFNWKTIISYERNTWYEDYFQMLFTLTMVIRIFVTTSMNGSKKVSRLVVVARSGELPTLTVVDLTIVEKLFGRLQNVGKRYRAR